MTKEYSIIEKSFSWTKTSNTPLYPKNFFLADGGPVFLWFPQIGLNDGLLQYCKFSNFFSLAWPCLIKPPLIPFQNTLIFSFLSFLVRNRRLRKKLAIFQTNPPHTILTSRMYKSLRFNWASGTHEITIMGLPGTIMLPVSSSECLGRVHGRVHQKMRREE